MNESRERANYVKNRRRGFKINRKGKPETKSKRRRKENNKQAKVFADKKINNKKKNKGNPEAALKIKQKSAQHNHLSDTKKAFFLSTKFGNQLVTK